MPFLFREFSSRKFPFRKSAFSLSVLTLGALIACDSHSGSATDPDSSPARNLAVPEATEVQSRHPDTSLVFPPPCLALMGDTLLVRELWKTGRTLWYDVAIPDLAGDTLKIVYDTAFASPLDTGAVVNVGWVRFSLSDPAGHPWTPDSLIVIEAAIPGAVAPDSLPVRDGRVSVQATVHPGAATGCAYQ